MKSAFLVPVSHRFKVLACCRVYNPNSNSVGEGMAQCLIWLYSVQDHQLQTAVILSPFSWCTGMEWINWLVLLSISDSSSQDCSLSCHSRCHHLCRTQQPLDSLFPGQLCHLKVIMTPLTHSCASKVKSLSFPKFRLLNCNRELSQTWHSNPKLILERSNTKCKTSQTPR